MPLSTNTRILLVLSGKGGVGKSSVSVQLSLSLAGQGFKVGLLDIDLCGPSVPRMMNILEADIMQTEAGWMPITVADDAGSIFVMSIGFLLPSENSSVVWRGPKKTAMIRQFLDNVAWPQDLDFLVIDTPPGTSDEHLAIMEQLQSRYPANTTNIAAVMVTTPQAVSLNDVLKEIQFCRIAGLPILGLVENMSGYLCPHCNECNLIFSQGGGSLLAAQKQIPFLGSLPIDPQFNEWVEDQDRKNVISEYLCSNIYNIYFQNILKEIKF